MKKYPIILFLLTAFCIILSLNKQVMAHAELLESIPSAGEQIEGTPSVIVLLFNGSLATDSTLLLLDEEFANVADLTASINPDNPAQAIATLPFTLDPGNYTVQWTAVSEDGHPISGSFSFEVLSLDDGNVRLIWLILTISIGAVIVLYQGIRRELWIRRSKKE